jgi:hypothetical protein
VRSTVTTSVRTSVLATETAFSDAATMAGDLGAATDNELLEVNCLFSAKVGTSAYRRIAVLLKSGSATD